MSSIEQRYPTTDELTDTLQECLPLVWGIHKLIAQFAVEVESFCWPGIQIDNPTDKCSMATSKDTVIVTGKCFVALCSGQYWQGVHRIKIDSNGQDMERWSLGVSPTWHDAICRRFVVPDDDPMDLQYCNRTFGAFTVENGKAVLNDEYSLPETDVLMPPLKSLTCQLDMDRREVCWRVGPRAWSKPWKLLRASGPYCIRLTSVNCQTPITIDCTEIFHGEITYFPYL
jgi:hypothetical protein